MKLKMMLSSCLIRLDLMLSRVRLELMSRVPGAAVAASCTLATALQLACELHVEKQQQEELLATTPVTSRLTAARLLLAVEGGWELSGRPAAQQGEEESVGKCNNVPVSFEMNQQLHGGSAIDRPFGCCNCCYCCSAAVASYSIAGATAGCDAASAL